MNPPFQSPGKHSLRVQFKLAMALLFVLFTGFVVVLIVLLDQVDSGRSGVKEEWREVDQAIELSWVVDELQRLAYQAVVEGGLPEAAALAEARADFEMRLADLEAYQLDQDLFDPDEQRNEGNALAGIASSYAGIERSLDAAPESASDFARAYRERIHPGFEELNRQLNAFLIAGEHELEASLATIKVAEERFEDALLLWTLGLLTLISVFLVAFAAYVIRPITRLHEGVQRIARRQFGERIQVRRRNELGDLADAINDMAGKLADYTRQVESELARNQRLAALGRLSAGLAHEVNNPLASIAICSEGLERRWLARGPDGSPANTEDMEYLGLIRQEVARCKSITEKLLDFSRKGPAKMEAVDLGAVVHETIRLVSHQFAGRSIRFEFDGDDAGICVRADHNQVKQVVLNLLLNAADAVQNEGRIDIRLLEQDGGVRLDIRDDGVGMTADQLDEVFEPFYTTKEPGEGTGLGLALSYGIVQAYGGELRAASEGLGRGSTLTVTLPAMDPARPRGRGREEASTHAVT